MTNTTRPSLISGGHRGAEAEFGRSAKRWGIEQTTLSFEGHAMEWPVNVKVLSDAELAAGDISMEIVSKRMGRTYHEADLIRRVIQSLYFLVNDSYQVFALGWIQPDDTVKGGTGWGVELAKLFNREVWVYDQGRLQWFNWSDGRWNPDEPKIGNRAFAGTGTRNLSPEGKAAIEALFERSFGKPKA
ncbi:MAG: hypothetical protein ABI639_04415 [Thermoanaerobaculia bacterium]